MKISASDLDKYRAQFLANVLKNKAFYSYGTLTFEKPDLDTFRCLPLCIKAINEGGILPTVVNGANEEAVRLFLDGKCKFLQIAELVEKALNSVNNIKDFIKYVFRNNRWIIR